MKWIVAMLIAMSSYCLVAEEMFEREITLVCAEWLGYTNSDGTGVYWDIIKRVYEPSGIKVQTQTVPWKRAKYSVKNNEKEAYVGDYFDPSKDKVDYLYPTEHLSIEESVVVVFKNKYASEWQSEGTKMLNGKRVAWVRDYGFESGILDGVDLHHKEVGSHTQALLQLANDRVEAVVDYQSNIVRFLEQDIEKYTLSVLEEGQKLFIVFSNTKKSAYLATVFDQRIKEMRKSGEIDAIYLKYGLTPPSNK